MILWQRPDAASLSARAAKRETAGGIFKGRILLKEREKINKGRKPVPERSADSQIREIELKPISASLDDAAKCRRTVCLANLSDLHEIGEGSMRRLFIFSVSCSFAP